jgi:hypothetical protein
VTRQRSAYTFEVSGRRVAALVGGATPQAVARGTAFVRDGRVQSLMYHSAAGAGTTVTFTFSGVGTASPVTLPAGAPG